MKARSTLYLLAQILGDINAARNGTVIKRVQRRMMGRFTGKTLIRRLVRK